MTEPLLMVDSDGDTVLLYPTDKLDLMIDGKLVPILSIEPDGTPKLLHPAYPEPALGLAP